MLYPSSMLFMMTLLLGTTLAISCSSWFGAWMGLELNLMSFLAIIVVKNSQYSSEAALKYFLTQALASLVIMFSAIFFNLAVDYAQVSMTISLLLKSGAAPFHFWFPAVMESLNWSHATILMTIQKIAPLSLLSHLSDSAKLLFMMSAIVSALVGAMGGLNQTSLRKLLTYSSINHMAWMLMAITMSELMWIIYLFTYSLMVSTITYLFFSQQSFYISSLISNKNNSMFMKMITFMSLFSLGGLPPFTGFFIKWMMIQELTMSSDFIMLLFLLGSALLTLFFYMRILSFTLLMSHFTPKWTTNKKEIILITPLFISINFLGMFLPSFLILTA
uniref:NADH-ubiquinone oxidoreductase chain 2 n=1 Tax=Spongicola levigatus TaxID=1873861 RepID=A0A3S5FUJ2_9EUCA|nr:NADH dehydrogenase subunit 2 [Spongicola levigatus]